MSIYGGPDTKTDGLILHLKASNDKSFTGSGNQWTDISGKGRNFKWSRLDSYYG